MTDETATEDQSDGTPAEIVPEESTPVETRASELELQGAAPETVNLVSSIDAEEQKRIGDMVYEDFDRDWDSSAKFREKRAQLVRLCIGELPPKEEGYAQIHYSVIMKAVVKLHARVYDQQFPSNGEFFGCRPTSAADLPRSVRVAKHMNWQILHQIPEYVPNHDRLIMQWYIYGSAFSFMYWNPVLNRPCHEVCATEDVVLPYAYPSEAGDPSLSKLPRITRIVRKYRFGADGLDALAKSGYYDQKNVDAIFEKDGEGSTVDAQASDGPVAQVIDKASGVEKPESEKNTRRILLEQHRWWKLPEWDEYRPVIVCIDKETRKLLGFFLREDEDPQDRARFNREKAANDAQHALAMQQYQADLAQYEANVLGLPLGTGAPPTVMQPPLPGATDMTAPPAPGVMTPSVPMAPVPPVEPPRPAPPKMIPINFFTHFICIPNPEGIYGFGIGSLLEGNNLTADALTSALVTSAMLSNTPTGIRSRETKLRGGEFHVRPGEIPEVDVPPEQLDKCIHLFKFPPPEPQLGNVVKTQMEDAEELSGASEILSGEVGGSNETATTTQIRISQALAAISIQNKRYTRARTCEGEKLARFNSVYLADKDYFPVIDPFHKDPPTDEEIGRSDYLEDVAITVTADPRMASQPQRFQEAMQAVQIAQQLAPVAPWLQGNAPFWAALMKNVWMAMDRPDLVALSAPPPPMPMQPPLPGMTPPVPGVPPPGPPQPPPGPQGGPPQRGNGGPPRPHPAPVGRPVPNGGPTDARNAPFMGQNS